MKQMILRINEYGPDVEILEHDMLQEKEYFSTIKINDLIDKLELFVENRENIQRPKNIVLFDENIIGVGNNSVVIKQSEHKRVVTYKNKAYKITFPNSIYIIEHKQNRIGSIEAYCYKEFEHKQTKLFKYAMPNMLSGNKICMGSAPKEILNSDFLQALEKIIFTQYSHSHVDNIKSFKETEKYFEYLSENDFPYDLLISTNFKLNYFIS